MSRAQPSAVVACLDRWLYPSHVGNWDNELFRSRVLSVVRPNHRVLDLGAGAGIVPQMNFRGVVAHICGIDPDPRVLENAYLDEAIVGTGDRLPFPDDSFDVVFSANVLEHLDHPESVLREVARVLRPGGLFLAKTPNRLHYVALIAAATPDSFHRWVNRKRGRTNSDTFPTLYAANTRRAICRIGAAAGLTVISVELVEGRPEYLRISALSYLFGWAYERVVNLVPGLDRFRVVMIATMEKPPPAVTLEA